VAFLKALPYERPPDETPNTVKERWKRRWPGPPRAELARAAGDRGPRKLGPRRNKAPFPDGEEPNRLEEP